VLDRHAAGEQLVDALVLGPAFCDSARSSRVTACSATLAGRSGLMRNAASRRRPVRTTWS
jgi:hypothetical protein